MLGRAPLPLLARRGGRDIKKSREASTRSGRGGGSNILFEFEPPPRLCRQWWLRNIFFLAQPPLLARRGNGARPNIHTTPASSFSPFHTFRPRLHIDSTPWQSPRTANVSSNKSAMRRCAPI